MKARTVVVAVHHPIHNPRSRLKTALEGLSDADALAAILQGQRRGLVIHGHLHRRVRRELATKDGVMISVGATSASLHHHDPARRAGFNLYDVDDSGAVTRLDAHVFEPERGSFTTAEIPSA